MSIGQASQSVVICMAAKQGSTRDLPGLEWVSTVLIEALQIRHSWHKLRWLQWMARRSLLLFLPLTSLHLPSRFRPLSFLLSLFHCRLRVCQSSAECSYFLFAKALIPGFIYFTVFLTHFLQDNFYVQALLQDEYFTCYLSLLPRLLKMSLFCPCTRLIVSVGIKFQGENHLPPEHSIIFQFPKFLQGKPKPFEF